MFNEELKGISQVIAKNTTLKIKFPTEMLDYDKTYIYNSNKNGSELEIRFNDVFSEEQKAILIRFRTKGKITSPVVMECSLSYSNNNKDTMVAISDVRRSEIKPAAAEKEYESGFNRAASEGFALQVSGELYEEAVQASNLEKYDDAKSKIKQAKELLSLHFKTFGDHPFLKDLYTKFTEYENIIEDLKHMDKDKVRFYIKSNKHKRFRSVSCPAF